MPEWEIQIVQKNIKVVEISLSSAPGDKILILSKMQTAAKILRIQFEFWPEFRSQKQLASPIV